MKHKHSFKFVRPKGSILRCACGRWKFSQYAKGPRIVNQPPAKEK